LISGGEDKRESRIVGRLVSGVEVMSWFGDGDRRWERREYI
jgi:hypothetical protein